MYISMFCYDNKIIILNDMAKLCTGNNLFKLDFCIIRVNHYLRRESKQYEYKYGYYEMDVEIPETLDSDIENQKKYLSNCWVDYLKNTLKSWSKFKIIDISTQKNPVINTPYIKENEFSKSFDEISKLFVDIAMTFDIQPSLLNVYSYSGYLNESSYFIYNYTIYLNDINTTLQKITLKPLIMSPLN